MKEYLKSSNMYMVGGIGWHFDPEYPPCENAFPISIPELDHRDTDDPSKMNMGGITTWWYGRGANHRVVNGTIYRDLDIKDYWAIEIDSLDDLEKFLTTYGKCVLRVEAEGYKYIEIYDDFRE